MTAIDRQQVRRLARASTAAVRDALARIRRVRIWDLLQERDADGNAKGPLPYTALAWPELQAAHAADPEDIGLVHHLAIAAHARAWDLELSDSPAAASAWEEALGYWRILAFSAEFWDGLKAKLRACDMQADVGPLDQARRDLLEDLLDIHVAFVRHYSEKDRVDHAVVHVQIVQRANIPPALKRRLVGKIYEAMTAGVGAAKLAREFASAAQTVERFLALFPDHLPALRLHAEVYAPWVKSLHFRDHWNEIERLSRQADRYGQQLAGHPDLDADPLAKTALAELSWEFSFQAYHRGSTHLAALEQSQQDFDLLADRVMSALDVGLPWAERGSRASPPEAQVRDLYAGLLAWRGQIRSCQAGQLGAEGRPRQALALLRGAVTDFEESLRWRTDETVTEMLTSLKTQLSALPQTPDSLPDLLS
jgi:hypothetical protein